MEEEMITSARGAKVYVGKPCPNGHSGERYVSNRNCVVCSRESEWQLTHHPASNLKAVHRYYVVNRGRILEKQRRRRKIRDAAPQSNHKENF